MTDVKVPVTPVSPTATPTPASSPEPVVAPLPVVDELIARLNTLGVDPDTISKIKSELGASSLDDLPNLTEEDLLKVGMKALPARKLVLALKPAVPTAVEVGSMMGSSSADLVNLLAPVPESRSMLDGLSLVQIGKIERTVVSNGIRAALASRAGLFDVPAYLLELMNDFVTNRMEEPAPQSYYDLEDEVAKQDNAEVLRLLKVSGRYTTKERKHEFLGRIGRLWQPAKTFQEQLQAWYEAYLKVAGSPAAMMAAMTSLAGGGRSVLPVVTSTPDTSPLHDGAQLVIQSINAAFAGRNIPAAMALAFDAERINAFLTSADVIRYTGSVNREELARTLGKRLGSTLVTPDYRRLENVLVQFVLSVYEIDARAPLGTPQELQYIMALYMLGQNIPWDRLFDGVTNEGGRASNKLTGIGGRGKRDDL
ncbi:TPA: hypothetical protein DF272_02880 [Candidatus Falkowbacteria bacterium]|nr:hypothetical protein [Candidatus Falkowbacteria bacterium]